MILYIADDENIHDLPLRLGQIILNQIGKDWLEYGNALIVAGTAPSLRVWQPERDIDRDFKLTGRRQQPAHPSLDHPPSLYYLSRGNLFICDTADEANAIIGASLPARQAQISVREDVYKDKPELGRRLTGGDVERFLDVRERARTKIVAIYAELTDGKYTDPESSQTSTFGR